MRMGKRAILLLTVVAAMLLACAGVVLAQQTAPDTQQQPTQASSEEHIPVCPGPADPGTARCHSRVVLNPTGNNSDNSGEATGEDTTGQASTKNGREEKTSGASKPTPKATISPTGLTPTDLQTAYNIDPNSVSNGPTVAIVDAYDNPKAEEDLGVFRKQFGLPECTTSNGCFTKVNQSGVTGSYPRGDQGWALEIALDVQAVSAICPNCKILLVEANTNSYSNLMQAVDTATARADYISNSYGGSEFSSETSASYDGHFINKVDKPTKAITVSSGDNGYGVSYPAASQYVTAVGGTTLNKNISTGTWSETAWSGSGSGCSAYESKPSWQMDTTGCSKRTVADVAADADPASGLSVYNSYGYKGQKGWFKVGGTSLSAPIIAAVYAMAGNASDVTYGSYPYSHTSGLTDITSGSNGSCDTNNTYLCTGVAGYDGPTGLGTPKGTGGF